MHRYKILAGHEARVFIGGRKVADNIIEAAVALESPYLEEIKDAPAVAVPTAAPQEPIKETTNNGN